MRHWAEVTLIVLGLLTFAWCVARAEEPRTWQCVSPALGRIMEVYDVERDGTGYRVEGYDRSGDREVDFRLWYQYVNGKVIRPFPSFYQTLNQGEWYGKYDGEGNGECKTIERRDRQ